MLTDHAIEGVVNHLIEEIAAAKYVVNGVEYAAVIRSVTALGGGKLRIVLVFDDAFTLATKITAIRLYDASGELLAEKTENILRASGQDAVVYRIVIDVQEGA